jgi:MFS family permease
VEDVDAEIKEIHKVARQQQRFSPREMIAGRVRPLLIIGVVMAVMQQLIGINTVIYYGATILGYAGFSTNSSIAQAVFIGLVNLLGAVIAVFLLDRVGRRGPLLTGTAGSVIGLIVLGLYFAASAHFQHAHAWIALVAMMFYIACFEISLGPIFWVMIAEIFPLKARATAMAVCTMFNWGFNFLVSFFFLDLVKALSQDGTFFLYAAFGVLAIIFFAWRVPETKDRSLEQIESDVHGEPQLNPERRRQERSARRESGRRVGTGTITH